MKTILMAVIVIGITATLQGCGTGLDNLGDGPWVGTAANGNKITRHEFDGYTCFVAGGVGIWCSKR